MRTALIAGGQAADQAHGERHRNAPHQDDTAERNVKVISLNVAQMTVPVEKSRPEQVRAVPA
ncbi:MAG: hypothetical protein H6822_09625 [Planctomycetaceae bacterium]|nr:hypothetical protein [Planctomycetales bacterium]MCB9922430.1 hypothetical protein [Planctomycetaceae bacterium]